ncbi:MAG: ATP-binding protein, partial [Actinomycetales bacterium]
PVRGVLPAVLAAQRAGFRRVVVCPANAHEAELVEGVDVLAVRSLAELVGRYRGEPVREALLEGLHDLDEPAQRPAGSAAVGPEVGREPLDLADVAGQEEARRAVEVAAAGGHHLFMVGPPGAGKTMLASRLPGLLPDLERDVAVEVTAVHSLLGYRPAEGGLVRRPPYVDPHHTASVASIVGGGSGVPRPGAVSLAHGGVLFLDDPRDQLWHTVPSQREGDRESATALALPRGRAGALSEMVEAVARVLGVVRLSRDRDDSTSVIRQRADIERWAAANGHEVIGWAEDVDVSGSVPPWERVGLGQWLPNPLPEPGKGKRPDGFDVVAVYRLDRLTRRVLHLARLLEWSEATGVRIVSTSEGFDPTTPMGRLLVQILAALAEGELEAIRERARSSSTHLLKSGRWRGGWVPYGYSPVKAERGWTLEPEPKAAENLRSIVERVIAGESVNSVAADLNRRGVPSPTDAQRIARGNAPTGAKWRMGNLAKMLRSQSMLGHSEMTETIDGEKVTRLIRGSDGLPLQRAEPLITRERWDALQAALDGRQGTPAMRAASEKRSPAPLLQTAFCGECGRPLYQRRGRGGRRYMRCSSSTIGGVGCEAPSIAAEQLEQEVFEAFLALAGRAEVMRRVLIPGESHTAELADVERALTEMREDRAAGLWSGPKGADEYRTMAGALEARRQALSTLPARPDEYRDEPTGENYAERFNALSTDVERGQELRRAGVRVLLFAEPQRTPSLLPGAKPHEGSRVSIELPNDLAARIDAMTRRG